MLGNYRSHNRTRAGRSFLLLILVVTLLLSGCGGAQQTKVYHVGILSGSDAMAPIADGFKAKMPARLRRGQEHRYDSPKATADRPRN
jgi:hypothetical protein